MGRLPAAVLVLGLPVPLLALVDRLGESPGGLALAVLALFGTLAIVGALGRRRTGPPRRASARAHRPETHGRPAWARRWEEEGT